MESWAELAAATPAGDFALVQRERAKIQSSLKLGQTLGGGGWTSKIAVTPGSPRTIDLLGTRERWTVQFHLPQRPPSVHLALPYGLAEISR